MADFSYEVLEQLGIFVTSKNGWTKEINLISWNGGEEKYDIRSWSPDHKRMGKGISMTKDELIALKELLEELEL